MTCLPPIFFTFKWIADTILESSCVYGQITVLTSSGPSPNPYTFHRSFLQPQQQTTGLPAHPGCRTAGRPGDRAKAARSPGSRRVIHDQGRRRRPSTVLSSQNYLENFGYATFPHPEPCGRVPRSGRNPLQYHSRTALRTRNHRGPGHSPVILHRNGPHPARNGQATRVLPRDTFALGSQLPRLCAPERARRPPAMPAWMTLSIGPATRRIALGP